MDKAKLMAMNAKELKARLVEIGKLSAKAEGEELDALMDEAEIINGMIQDAKNREKLAKIASEAGPESDPANTAGEGESGENALDKAKEERGAKLKNGAKVKFKAKTAITGVNNKLSVAQTATPTHTAPDVAETFNDVSSLVDRVRVLTLTGGETYQRGYVKSYGDGAGNTAEGADYSATEPVFGYVTIEKQKITAYTEEPEEMIKLPNADYDTVVEGSVTKAIRRYMNRQIMIGDGKTGKFKGIFHNPLEPNEQVIDPETDIELTAIDGDTLDEIIYSYGGPEEVEDLAVLILNKLDLKAFAKVKDKQGRKLYTIVNHGNTGTIDGVPYLIDSACGVVTTAQTEAEVYCMAYGPLTNYELPVFSDIDARKSVDYKFKQGQVAYRADIFAGGAVAAYNGFIRVKRPAAAA